MTANYVGGGQIRIDPDALAPVAAHVKTAWLVLEAAPSYTHLEAGDRGGSVQHKLDMFNNVYKPHREELVKSLEFAAKILEAASRCFGSVETDLINALQGTA